MNMGKADELKRIAEAEGFKSGDRIKYRMPSSHALRSGVIRRTIIDPSRSDVPLYVHLTSRTVVICPRRSWMMRLTRNSGTWLVLQWSQQSKSNMRSSVRLFNQFYIQR